MRVFTCEKGEGRGRFRESSSVAEGRRAPLAALGSFEGGAPLAGGAP